jgi:radical SAM superfamily enzyme YgiQ (UPF0313 family)
MAGRANRRGEDDGEYVRRLEEILKEKGLTDKQVKAGVRYYVNFASKFDIPPARVADMIVRMIENMKKAYEKGVEES